MAAPGEDFDRPVLQVLNSRFVLLAHTPLKCRRAFTIAGACLLLAPAPAPAAFAVDPSPRATAPDTTDCPYRLQPGPAVDESEIPSPGADTPTPLPVPETYAGGETLAAECGVSAAPGFAEPADLTASAWLVFDLDSQDVIAAKDPHGRYRPASIIKVLLALVAIENLDLDTQVIGTQEDANIEGSRVGIGPEGQYTVEQLLQGLVMASGNDAAHALAGQLGGTARTLELVNAKAKELGTQSTRVTSYSGLDAPGLQTTPFDIALMYNAAWHNPVFARLVGTRSVDFPGYQDTEGFEVWNDNGLLSADPTSFGGKTGYTDDARHTFVGGATRGGRRLVAVIMDTTIDKGRPWEQAQRLIDAAAGARGSVGTVAALPREDAADGGAAPTPAAVAGTGRTGGSGWPTGWVWAGVIALLAAVGLWWSLRYSAWEQSHRESARFRR